jgi:carboxyl-terminal processing protease
MTSAPRRRRLDLSLVLALGALLLVLATGVLLFLDLRERRRIERHLRFAGIEDEARFFEEVAAYAAIRKKVLDEYVEPVEPQEFLLDALDGGVRALDAHSRLIRPEDQAAVEEQARGEYHGIGVRIDRAAPALTVLYPLEGSPADLAGLRPGDRIVRIDEEELGPADHAHGIEILKGRGNTRVLLQVVNDEEPGAKPRSVEAWRQPVPEPSVRHPRALGPGVGYLAIAGFTPQTKLELLRGLEFLEQGGARSFVLDLRQNGGGSYDAAVECARLFVPEGVIVSERGRGLEQQVLRAVAREALFAGRPLAVLVDRATASAAEILAGALQDHGLAVLLGERTYGKGVVQSTQEIPGLLQGQRLGLRLTTEYYFTPLGRNFESRGNGPHGAGGLLPDLLVPSDERTLARVRAWIDDLDVPEKHREGVERYAARVGREFFDEKLLEEDQLVLAAQALLSGERPRALRLPRQLLER